MLTLSVLDQSAAGAGRHQDATIRQTLALATKCETWGYKRFWVSEHHSHPSIVGTAPEVLMAAIAAQTKRIRLGSAGVMLPHYAPLKVAEQFRVLDALAPGRIDLGVGRAPGSDGRTAQLLNPDRYASDNFPQQVMELQAWVTGEPLPAGHPGHGVFAYPSGPTSPNVWMLGSSDYGAQLAAHLSLPYAFAYFITDGQGADQAMHLYRSNFRPTEARPKPEAVICVWALAADTEAEAWRLFESRARWKMDRNLGRIDAILPPEKAVRDYSAGEQRALTELKENALVGTAKQVVSKLRALAERLQIEEIVVITWTHDPAAQARSYELLAQEIL
ncbi:MAG: LLM class flavin-dependent oxidoreductase [Betaproteobacteria bacterium]|nr:LLM class flavin-dependent oxidoreductase [Betaproteobacteria bacterium]